MEDERRAADRHLSLVASVGAGGGDRGQRVPERLARARGGGRVLGARLFVDGVVGARPAYEFFERLQSVRRT